MLRDYRNTTNFSPFDKAGGPVEQYSSLSEDSLTDKDYDYHLPVLYRETLEALEINKDGCYLDGTMGGGGHSAGILEKLSCQGRLICLDKDEMAIEAGRAKLETVHTEARYDIVRSDFADFDKVLAELNVNKLDGAILDIGVSSAQVDEAERGFSYMQDGPLDMRMDRRQRMTAAEILNNYPELELKRIFSQYGEERYSGRIASAVVRDRRTSAFTTTKDFVDCLISAIPSKARREKQHPAKRCFQALRIEVNGELRQLEKFLEQIPKYMKAGGRLAVISFHSLEDRIVKQAYRSWENPGFDSKLMGLPPLEEKSIGKAIPRKGITAGEKELEQNPRARSARLRVFEFREEVGEWHTQEEI